MKEDLGALTGSSPTGQAASHLVASRCDPARMETQIAMLTAALAPFSAMGRLMEKRATINFGKHVPDGEKVCTSSGEAGLAVLTMGHFRDAAALLPKAPGWGGIYRPPFDRDSLEGVNQ